MIIAPFLELGPGDWQLFDVGEYMAMNVLLHQRILPQLAAKAWDQLRSVAAETAKLRHYVPNLAASKPGIRGPAGRRHQFVPATVIG